MQNTKPDTMLFKQIRERPDNPRTGLKVLQVTPYLIPKVCKASVAEARVVTRPRVKGGGEWTKLQRQYKMGLKITHGQAIPNAVNCTPIVKAERPDHRAYRNLKTRRLRPSHLIPGGNEGSVSRAIVMTVCSF